jgi:hypothetical protein
MASENHYEEKLTPGFAIRTVHIRSMIRNIAGRMLATVGSD